MAILGFGRGTKDKPVKRATGRGRGAGRTRNTRMDDLQDARDKRKPQGVTSPIKDAAKPAKPPTAAPRPPKADKQSTTAVERPKAPKAEVKPTVVRRAYNNPAMNKKLVDKENAQKKAAAKDAKKTPAKSKSPVVTPKMIKDAGFTTLRDYLNAKQGKTRVKGAPTVTGKNGRNVGKGDNKKANVTREQLVAAGLTTGPKGLKTYLDKYDKLGRRPKPSDFKKPAEKKNKPTSPASAEGRGIVRKAKGGMMKSKMKAKGMKAGGKMKTKGYMAGGLKDAPEGNKGLKKLPKQVRNKMGFKAKGGMMKTKGYAKGGMKTKGYMAGGKMKAKGMAKGGKVRGAGIARKGVRPVKMR